MSKAEILQELPKLKPDERQEVLERLWQMNEDDLLGRGATPSAEEKALLDRELSDYESNPNAGASWSDVEARLRARVGQ